MTLELWKEKEKKTQYFIHQKIKETKIFFDEFLERGYDYDLEIIIQNISQVKRLYAELRESEAAIDYFLEKEVL
jgi:uncharacterized protein (UPF0128 family)